MSDPNSTLWSSVAGNAVPLTPSEQQMMQETTSPSMPSGAAVNQALPDLSKMIATKVATSPRYKAVKGTEQPSYDTRKAIISTFPGIAQLLGTKPEEIEAAKEWRQQNDAANLANAEKVISENKPYGNAVSATQGLVSGATMGAPEALQKLLGPGNGQETTQQVKEQYPVANLAGNIAGAVGSSFAIPGAGDLVAAKGGVLAGKGLLPLIGKQALNAATFAVPTAINQGIASENPGETWKDLKQNMLYGTLGGVTLSKVFAGAPKIAKVMDEVANDMAINAAIPGASRVIKNVASGGIAGKVGMTAEHLADLKSNVADMILKNKLFSKADVEAFTQGNGKIWDSVDNAFKASGAKPSDFLGEIINHPDIAQWLNDPKYGSEVANYIEDTLQRGDSLVDFSNKTGAKALPKIRKILDTDMKIGFKSDNAGTALKGEVADAMHDVIDGHFVPPELKASWPAMKMLKLGTARAESTIRGVEAGSPTAPREILAKMIGGGEGGGIIGAMSTRDFDPSDPTSWANLGINMTLGTVAGSMANKGLARLANHLGGKTAGILKGLAKLAPSGGEGLGSTAAKMLGTGQGQALLPAAGALIAPTAPTSAPMGSGPAPSAPQAAGQLPEQIPMQPIPNASATPPPPTPAQQMQDAQSNFVNPTKAPAPQVDQSLLNHRIGEWYQIHTQRVADGLTQDQFAQQLREATDNFSPDNPLTYRVLVDDPAQAEKLQKDYQVMKKLNGVNLENVFNYYRYPLSHIGGTRFETENARDMQQQRDNLIEALKTMGVGDMKKIDERLKIIAWSRKTQANKEKEVYQMIQDQGGINVGKLIDLGLWQRGGTNAAQ